MSWNALPSPARSPWREIALTVGALVLLMAWDFTGWDMALAAPWGSPTGFPLQHNWFLAKMAHESARRAAWLPAIWLIVGVWWPTGFLRRLTQPQRVEWVTLLLLAPIIVLALRYHSLTSCPWDLTEFGGHARWVSHWASVSDGGPGRCFPAAHASAGFAYISGYFVLRHSHPRAARWCLTAALIAGFLFGAAQQLRGAHFMSHTLWTAWICWTTAWLGDLAFRRLVSRPGRS